MISNLCRTVPGGEREGSRDAPRSWSCLVPSWGFATVSSPPFFLSGGAWTELGRSSHRVTPPGCCDNCGTPPGETHTPARPAEQELSLPAWPGHAAHGHCRCRCPCLCCISSSQLLHLLPRKWQSKCFAKRIRAFPAASPAAPASLGPRVAFPGQTPSLSQMSRSRPWPQHSRAQALRLPARLTPEGLKP